MCSQFMDMEEACKGLTQANIHKIDQETVNTYAIPWIGEINANPISDDSVNKERLPSTE